MIRIGVISNPGSSRNRRGLDAFERPGRQHSGVLFRRLGRDGDSGAVLAELAEQDTDVLAINGGDGTVQRLLTTLLVERPFARPPLLAVLAGGTTNLIAADAGLPGRPARGLARLLELARGARLEHSVRQRHVMRIDGLAGDTPQCGMFLGLGALARIVEDHAARRVLRHLPAPLALTRTVARVVADGLRARERRRVLRGDPIRIRLDGGAQAPDARLLMFVTTLSRLLLGTRLYWSQGDGPLRFTSVADPPQRLLWSTCRLLAGADGRRLPPACYVSGSARRIDLDAAPLLALDGELFAPPPGGTVAISAPYRLRFVAA